MNPLSLALVAAGIALVAVGLARARVPWARYQAMRAQEANAERYRAWRGGLGDAAGGTTGAGGGFAAAWIAWFNAAWSSASDLAATLAFSWA